MSERAKRIPANTYWCQCCQGREASCVGASEGIGVWVLACDKCCSHDGKGGYCVPLSEVADLVQKRTKSWEKQRERADALEQQLAQVTRERDEAIARAERAEARAAVTKPQPTLSQAYAAWHAHVHGHVNGGHCDE